MKGFVLQIDIYGKYVDDAHTIANIINEHNWLYPEDKYEIEECTIDGITIELLTDRVPVGTIEFINKALSFFEAGPMQPINVPRNMRFYDFMARRAKVVKSQDELKALFTSWNQDNLFIKSNSRLKGGVADIYRKDSKIFDDSEYFVSECIDITSEWRCFIYRGKLRGIKHYSGDPWSLPKKDFIEKCIKTSGDSLTAYTLDVAVTEDGANAVIEIHNFAACGLYGFEDHILLPMLVNGFKRELNLK